MSRFYRIYRIHELLRSAKKPVPMRRFMEELEASRNTITRDFEYLRDSLGAPIEYCRKRTATTMHRKRLYLSCQGFG